jgi:cobalt-zinc-cadmium resistance protein CzcA
MNVRGRDLGGFVDEARKRVDAQAPLPPGMAAEWGGEFESKERAMARLTTVVPVALLLTLILLFKAFDSFGLALLTLANVPFALMGGVFALFALGMPLSVAAAVGFIALIGQAALNGVLVMSAVDGRRRRGEALDDDAILNRQPASCPPRPHDGGAPTALGLVPAGDEPRDRARRRSARWPS